MEGGGWVHFTHSLDSLNPRIEIRFSHVRPSLPPLRFRHPLEGVAGKSGDVV